MRIFFVLLLLLLIFFTPFQAAFSQGDTSLPTVFDIAARGTGAHTATISWQTSKPTRAEVRYIMDDEDTDTEVALIKSYRTFHILELDNLKDGGWYRFTITVFDSIGGFAVSELYYFLTDDITPPAISGVYFSNAQETSVDVAFTTNEASYGKVRYYPFNHPELEKEESDLSYEEYRIITLHELIPGTLYEYYVSAADRENNAFELSGVHYFETTGIQPEGALSTVTDTHAQAPLVLGESTESAVSTSIRGFEDERFSQVIQRERGYTQEADEALIQRLAGMIVLQVEEHGEAWYIDHRTMQRYYLPDGSAAYSVLRSFGWGITNDDIALIPIGIEPRITLPDADNDTLSDKLEEALGTHVFNTDSDGDGINDAIEIEQGTNPLGTGNLVFNHYFAEALGNRIMLQVESRGEAWYIHNSKRYYMNNGEQAYQIMRYLSLGISNNDLRKIPVGVLEE